MEGVKGRLLFLTYYFPPQANPGAFRSLGFAKYLPRHGWQPVVLTPGGFAYLGQDPDLLREIPAAVQVFRTPSLDHYRLLSRRGVTLLPEDRRQKAATLGKWFLFPDSKAPWIPLAYRTGVRLIRAFSPQLILATLPPFSLAFTAVRLGHRFRIPVVLDFRDPWRTIPLPYRSHPWMMDRYIQWALHRTAAVLAINRPIREDVAELGHPRVELLPHGFDPDLAPKDPPQSQEEVFRVVFTGTFYGFFSPHILLEAIRCFVVQKPRAVFDFYGQSAFPLGSRLSSEIRPFVRIHGWVPRRRAVAALFSATVNWFFIPKLSGSHYISSSKVADYILARRPILAVVDPESQAAHTLQAFRGVTFADPGDPKSACTALKRLYVQWMAGKLPPLQGPFERFDLRHLIPRMARLFEEITGP